MVTIVVETVTIMVTVLFIATMVAIPCSWSGSGLTNTVTFAVADRCMVSHAQG